MNQLFHRLPLDLVKMILSYEGTLIKERNGKYVNQILRTDDRIQMLSSIPVKHLWFVGKNSMGSYTSVHFTNNLFSMSITEYYDAVRYIMTKHGRHLDETRYLCR
jgi:hypothetical protein